MADIYCELNELSEQAVHTYNKMTEAIDELGNLITMTNVYYHTVLPDASNLARPDRTFGNSVRDVGIRCENILKALHDVRTQFDPLTLLLDSYTAITQRDEDGE